MPDSSYLSRQVLDEVARPFEAVFEQETVLAIESAVKVLAIAPVVVGLRVLKMLPPPEALWTQ